jgi:DNA repair protein RadC
MQDELFSVETIVAEIEISYTPNIKPSRRPKIKTPDEAYRLLIDTWDKSKIELVEQFKVILLTRAHGVLGICTLTSGTVTNTVADPKQVFSLALKANAVEIMLAHNHPSGSLLPSKSDEELTRKMKVAGQFLDLLVLDHIIVTTEGFYSFAKEGML